MRFLLPAAALAACLAGGSAMASTSLCDANAQNQVVNCGFETADFTAWLVSGNSAVTSQTNLYGVDNSNPYSGGYEAFFGTQGATNGTHLLADSLTISQDIALTESLTYQISFYLMQDTPVFAGYTNFFQATFDGATLMSETAAPVTGGYVLETFTVTGSASGDNVLAFSSQNDAGNWFLDDISLVEVPEPASLAVFGMGIFGLAALRRRNRIAA